MMRSTRETLRMYCFNPYLGEVSFVCRKNGMCGAINVCNLITILLAILWI